jgi:C4-dicarboxylate-binding protein DctP
VFFSKGRDVGGQQQIKDKKVRVFSDTMAKFVKLCGGEPTILTSGAINGALQDGKVDVAMAAISTVVNRELWKASDTITRTAHAPVEYLLFMNEKSWQALAPGPQGCRTRSRNGAPAAPISFLAIWTRPPISARG